MRHFQAESMALFGFSVPPIQFPKKLCNISLQPTPSTKDAAFHHDQNFLLSISSSRMTHRLSAARVRSESEFCGQTTRAKVTWRTDRQSQELVLSAPRQSALRSCNFQAKSLVDSEAETPPPRSFYSRFCQQIAEQITGPEHSPKSGGGET